MVSVKPPYFPAIRFPRDQLATRMAGRALPSPRRYDIGGNMILAATIFAAKRISAAKPSLVDTLN